MQDRVMAEFDFAIVGGGLAGSVAALALADLDYRTVLIGPVPSIKDTRTTALMSQSIQFLETLGLWQAILPHAAALSTMQILDGTTRLFRAPPVRFQSSEIGLDAFGYNIPNSALLAELQAAVQAHVNITEIHASCTSLDLSSVPVVLGLEGDMSVTARSVVAADGRNSFVRSGTGIDVRRWTYPQTAIVLNFEHSLPHRNVSTEFHTETGPFTQVPLPGNQSSLVWVQDEPGADMLMSFAPQDLSDQVERRMQSILGKVKVVGPVQAWPLSGMTANRFGTGNIALIGEAAHVFPPIGAQGLNLSLRDIMTLRDLAGPKTSDEPRGGIGDRFATKRRLDVYSRTASVDLLNRSLLSGFLPVQMLRAGGLHFLASVTPFKKFIMQEGIEPGGAFRAIPEMLRKQIRR
jgi:2-octaprenyl-6-methoxyphenol hydroxylase